MIILQGLTSTIISLILLSNPQTLSVAGLVNESGRIFNFSVDLNNIAWHRAVKLAGRLHRLQRSHLIYNSVQVVRKVILSFQFTNTRWGMLVDGRCRVLIPCCFISVPTDGSWAKTTSPSASWNKHVIHLLKTNIWIVIVQCNHPGFALHTWAYCDMPIVATFSPPTSTHSCLSVYRRSANQRIVIE